MTDQDLYLNLLKKVLTNTIHAKEPNHDDSSYARFIHDFVHHYIRGTAYTMVPVKRLDNIEHCLKQIEERQIPGDLIETGVWRGGSAIFMRAFLKVYGIRNRRVWAADSFQGLPQPDPANSPVEAKAHATQLMVEEYKHFAVSLEEVKANFDRFGLLDDQVLFLRGWFKDTLPTAPIERLALLRLDADYYESTMDSLVNLYPRLSIGGYVIVDDYGEDQWTYCRQAVCDFRDKYGVDDELIKVDTKCYYWKRSQ